MIYRNTSILIKDFKFIDKNFQSLSLFVPEHKQIKQSDLDLLQNFVRNSKKLLVLTGAGISTESGIPDYRSLNVGLYAKNSYRPIIYSEFINKHSTRKRYWARSFFGWNRIFNLDPNLGHLTLTRWQKADQNLICVTQNVDRLHHKAGTEKIIELHGNLFTVKCIQCQHRISRTLFQKKLISMNSNFLDSLSVSSFLKKKEILEKVARPDGDVDITDELVEKFTIPYCQNCQNGIFKPDIVFFGDNVPKQKVEKIYKIVEDFDSLLVLGSSLQVFSSFRFVSYAHQLNKPIAIVNIGPTRADTLTNILKLEAKIGDILPLVQLY